MLTEPIYFDVALESGGYFGEAIPTTHNGFIFVYEGSVAVFGDSPDKEQIVTLRDSLLAAAPRGIVCMTDILGNEWTLKEFTPMGVIPHIVKLTVYTGGAEDLPTERLPQFVDGVVAGRNRVNIDRVFRFDEIVEAHRYMESNQATGKLVVLVDELYCTQH